MGLLDRFAGNLGIQTDGNAERLDVAGYARLPADHPVVTLAEKAGERGMEASELEIRQYFGDPTSPGSSAPTPPRANTPARFNWVARRTIDQMAPRLEETHVDRRLPKPVREVISGVAASMIDPFVSTSGSVISSRMRDEAAVSKRVVGYLQASPEEVARRGRDMLMDTSDAGLRAEFELVPGTARMRIPNDQRGREAWIEERSRTEHAMARAGVLPASCLIDAATRMDISPKGASQGGLMESYVYPNIVHDAAMSLEEANAFTDIDLRFRFKELGGMGSVNIPSGPSRGEWIMSMLVEERQAQLLSGETRAGLASDRRSIEAAIPVKIVAPVSAQQQQRINVSFAINAAQAAGL